MRQGEMRILIADDEPPARARLAALLNELGGWQVVGEAANGSEALEQCAALNPDVLLLDIRMPGMDGIEVALALCKQEAAPAVIFTTAYDEYAVTAFETHAVGYLLKPVRRERLLRALEHAARLDQMKLAQLSQLQRNGGGRSSIPVSLSGKVMMVPTSSVIAFRAEHKYVQMLYEEDGVVHETLIDEPLKDLEAEFAADFMRVHRNSLVRVDRIASIEKTAANGHRLSLQGYDQPLQVSRRHYSEVKQRLRA